MKLYIKQKVFSWRDRFFIKAENGDDKYSAMGELFSWGHKLHICDASGAEVAFIRQKIFSWLRKYFIELDGHTYTLVKEFTFFRPRYHLEGIDWRMEGNIWQHEYTLNDNNGVVMRLSRHWFTWGNSYELDIPRPENELLCLAIALALDCMREDAESSTADS